MSTDKQYELSVQCQEKVQEVTTEMDVCIYTVRQLDHELLFFYISWLHRYKVEKAIVFAKSLFSFVIQVFRPEL